MGFKIMKRGPFEVTDSKTVYKNPWIEVKEDKVVWPNGKKGLFGTIDYTSGVSILSLTPNNEIYLNQEFHYAVGNDQLELPSGGVDSGETPLEAAQRELKEEIGVTAKSWTELGHIDPLTTILSCPNYLFLAENVLEGEATGEEKEMIKLIKLPFREVLQKVDIGEITHAATVVAILKVANLKGLR
jgi:8-oxo-dGTP pyrophosphatase MutT (NUDIX family)